METKKSQINSIKSEHFSSILLGIINNLKIENILIWNANDLFKSLVESSPQTSKLLVESSKKSYSDILDEIQNLSNFNNMGITGKIDIEFATVEMNISGENELKNYLLKPAKSPYLFDLVIINSIYEEECLKFANNYIHSESVILLVSEKYIPRNNELHGKEAIYLKANGLENQITFSIIANEKVIDKLSNEFKSSILTQDKSRSNNVIELFEREKLSIMFVHQYKENFLQEIYTNDEIIDLSYDNQLEYLISKKHLYSDYFSRHFENLDCRVTNIIANCKELQNKYYKEKFNVSDAPNTAEEQIETKKIIEHQIKDFKADIIFLVATNEINEEDVEFYSKQARILALFANNNTLESVPEHLLNMFDILFVSGKLSHSMVFNRIKSLEIPNLFDTLSCNSNIDYSDKKNNVVLICPSDDLDSVNYVKDLINCEAIISDFDKINSENLSYEIDANLYSNELFKKISENKIIIISQYQKVNEINPEITIENILGCGALLIINKDDIQYNECGIENKRISCYESGKYLVSYKSIKEAILLAKFYIENPKDAEKIVECAKKKILKNNLYEAYTSSMMKELEKVFIRKKNNL